MSWLIPDHIRSEFIAECLRATDDPIAFASFRRGAAICSVIENKSLDRIDDDWKIIKRLNPGLCAQRNVLKDIDSLGDPILVNIGKNQQLSATTVANLLDLSCLITCFGSLEGKSIVEIGGGYGSLAALICKICNPSRYTICDLPEVMALQKRFLGHLDISNVQFISDIGQAIKCDLVISDSALSEVSKITRNQYSESVLQYALAGWIEWNYSPAPSSVAGVHQWLQSIAPSSVWRAIDLVGYEHPRSGHQFVWGSTELVDPYPEHLWNRMKEGWSASQIRWGNT